jgi:hypothetical protein
VDLVDQHCKMRSSSNVRIEGFEIIVLDINNALAVEKNKKTNMNLFSFLFCMLVIQGGGGVEGGPKFVWVVEPNISHYILPATPKGSTNTSLGPACYLEQCDS